jgi:sulfur carrier protein
VKITVNGDAIEVVDGMSVGDLVRQRIDDRRHVAVACNGEVVPRAQWDTMALTDCDSVEVLAPTAGG